MKEQMSVSMKPMSVVLALACGFLSVSGAADQTPTSKIVTAANAFMATLDQAQRQAVLFAFNDEQQRARWSNLPTGAVPRAGIALKDMSLAQRSAAMAPACGARAPSG